MPLALATQIIPWAQALPCFSSAGSTGTVGRVDYTEPGRVVSEPSRAFSGARLERQGEPLIFEL